MESRKLSRSCSFVQAQVALKLFMAGAVLLCCGAGMADARATGKFNKLFIIGDSYADTGNRDPNNSTKTPMGPVNQDWRPPYGRTGPGGRPAGRFSNGKLLTDYLSGYMGLSPPPYRIYKAKPSTTIADGINFAVGGAGVFDNLGFTKTGDQVAQLKEVLNAGVYRGSIFNESLLLFVINGNDYAAYTRGAAASVDLLSFVLDVVNQVYKDLRSLYDLGFRNFAVSFISPLGCLPTVTATSNYTTCDPLVSAVATTHNSYLSTLVKPFLSLPGADLIFLNIELAFDSVLMTNLTQTDFPTPLQPCCIPTEPGALCGDVDSAGKPVYTVCRSPSSAFFWDDYHPTEAGWRYIFSQFLTSPLGLYTGGRSLPSFLR